MYEKEFVPNGIIQECANALGFKGAQGQDAHGRAEDFIEGNAVEFDEAVRKIWRMGREIFCEIGGSLDKVGELNGCLPWFIALGQHDGDDGREFFARWIGAQGFFPDANHVGEEAEGDPSVVGALVFEKDVEEGFGLIEGGGVEQVALGRGKFFSNKGAALDAERGPIDVFREAGREVFL